MSSTLAGIGAFRINVVAFFSWAIMIGGREVFLLIHLLTLTGFLCLFVLLPDADDSTDGTVQVGRLMRPRGRLLSMKPERSYDNKLFA